MQNCKCKFEIYDTEECECGCCVTPLRARKGIPLFIALCKAVPKHYRIFRKHCGRVASVYYAIKFAFMI